MPNRRNIFLDLSTLAALGPHAIVGKTVRIRKPTRVRIGDYSIIDDFTYVSCGLTVGRYTHVGAGGVLIGGDAHITIGDFVNIAPGCRIIAASNDFTGGGLVGPTIPEEFASPSIVADIQLGDQEQAAASESVQQGRMTIERLRSIPLRRVPFPDRAKVVATDQGSPGMLNRIDVIAPPNSAPQ